MPEIRIASFGVTQTGLVIGVAMRDFGAALGNDVMGVASARCRVVSVVIVPVRARKIDGRKVGDIIFRDVVSYKRGLRSAKAPLLAHQTLVV
jgi:hypothetical protein